MSIQLPQAVFFDLDNTILAYDSKSPQSWERSFAMFTPRLKGVEVQQFGQAMNDIRPWFWGDPVRDQRARLDLATARREMVALAFSRLGVDAGEAGSEMADAYGDIQEASIEVYPGAMNTLQRIREMGKGMALITNGVSLLQRAKINRFGLEPFFDCIIVEGEFWRGQTRPPGLPARPGAVVGTTVGGHDGGRQSTGRHRRRPVPGHTHGMGRLEGRRPAGREPSHPGQYRAGHFGVVELATAPHRHSAPELAPLQNRTGLQAHPPVIPAEAGIQGAGAERDSLLPL